MQNLNYIRQPYYIDDTGMMPELVIPTLELQDEFVEAIREMQTEGLWMRWNVDELGDDFQPMIDLWETDRLPYQEGTRVPQTLYFLLAEGKIVGQVGIRYYLNDFLRQFGGHIGYDIRPSMRRRGYGTLICRLGIEKARHEIGITEPLLITCDDDNIGSAKIIEANGGVFDKLVKVEHNPKMTRHYWIY